MFDSKSCYRLAKSFPALAVAFFLLAFPSIKADVLVRPQAVSTKVDSVAGEGGVRCVYVFEDLSDANLQTCNNMSADWYAYPDFAAPVSSGFNMFSDLADGSTYIVKIGDKSDTVAVIDYRQYRLANHNLSVVPQCASTSLSLDIQPMAYYDPLNISRKVKREFTVGYTTLVSDSTKWVRQLIEDTLSVTNPATIDLGNPLYIPTDIELHGDQFAQSFYDDVDFLKINADDYQPVAVGFIPKSYTSLRGTEKENEKDRVLKEDVLTGSAPLNVLFRSNATPMTELYLWEIKKSDATIAVRTETETRYVFDESGKYEVHLRLSNRAGCECDTVFRIDANESMLAVPNVFTPNGDNVNDEFRVVYRSLKSFSCLVFDRWQHQVYSFTDPAQGWDGRIGGRIAPEGAYYYVIEAVGTDGVKYKEKGAVNLLKGKKQ